MLVIALALAISLTPLQAATSQEYTFQREELLLAGEMCMFEFLVAEFGIDFVQNYERAQESFEQFDDSLPRNRMGEIILPEYYAGSYFDTYGNPVFLVANSSPISPLSSDSNIAQMQWVEGATVRYVEFTFRELWETKELLMELVLGNSQFFPSDSNAQSVGIDTISNRVVVGLIDYSEEMTKLFRETVFDSPIVTFEPLIQFYLECNYSPSWFPCPVPDFDDEPFAFYCEHCETFYDLVLAQSQVIFESNLERSMNTFRKLRSFLPRGASGDIVYPDYLLNYFMDENENPLIIVRSAALTEESTLWGVQSNDWLTIIEHKFTQDELLPLFDSLGDLFEEGLLREFGVVSLSISPLLNRVAIGIESYSDEMITLFRENIIDSPMLAFHQEEIWVMLPLEQHIIIDYPIPWQTTEEATITPFAQVVAQPGDILSVRVNGVLRQIGSIGFRAWLAGTNGFVTAAHIGQSLHSPCRQFLQTGTIVYAHNRPIGQVVHNNHVMRHGIDTAFITLFPGMDISTYGPFGRYTQAREAVGDQFGEGLIYGPCFTNARRPGSVTILRGMFGLTAGRIVDVSRSADPRCSCGRSTNALRGAVMADYPSRPGDSGGIVFTWNNLEPAVMGIHLSGDRGQMSLFANKFRMRENLGVWFRP